MLRPAKPEGENVWSLGGDRWITVDLVVGDFQTECEFQRNIDGTITVLDVRHYPTAQEEGRNDDRFPKV